MATSLKKHLINSDDISNQPFTRPEQIETLYKYARIGVQLVLMALKSTEVANNGIMDILYSDKQIDAIDELRMALKGGQSCKEEVLRLFEVLFFDENAEIQKTRNPASPLRCFLLIISLEKRFEHSTPQFSPAFSITPKIAAIQFLMRLVALEVAIKLGTQAENPHRLVNTSSL
jgi:hypothetical protein